MGPRTTTRHSGRPHLSLAIVLGTVLSALGVAAAPGLMSTWRTKTIVIDGMTSEWAKPEAVPHGPEVTVTNDAESVYFVVTSADDPVRGLLANGLILWLDPSGGKAQTFGIWAPSVTIPEPAGASPVVADEAPRVATSAYDHFDLLGPGKSQRRLVDITPALGIELASSADDKRVTYEVKIPIAKTAERLYAIGASPGKTIGLGIATPEAPRDRSGRRDVLVGSSGSVGGNPYRGGGFAPFPDRPETSKPLDVWTTVKLATN